MMKENGLPRGVVLVAFGRPAQFQRIRHVLLHDAGHDAGQARGSPATSERPPKT